MSLSRFGGLAAFGVTIFAAGIVSADDSLRLLAGTGSLRAASATATATLERVINKDADTLPACFWWRRWASLGAPVGPPVVAYSAPIYSAPPIYSVAAPAIAPPPAAGPATYYYPPVRAAEPVAVAPRPRPAIVVGYQGRYFSGSIAIRPLARAVGPAERGPEPFESAPPPQPRGSYRYDGGPARPVPMPVPDPVTPTDPVPTTVPALHRVLFERSRPRVNYSSFGERPAAKPAVAVDPLLVKRAGDR